MVHFVWLMVFVTYYRKAVFNNHLPEIAVGASKAFRMGGVPNPIFPVQL